MTTTALAAAVAVALAVPVLAEPHKVAIHVDEESIQKMDMARNNAANIRKYCDGIGEKVIIEIVTYGPGLHMRRADTSPVADRIAVMAPEYDHIGFSACLNTVQAMEQKTQTDVPLISEATVVPSGAVRLMELQQDGYSWLRP